MTYAPLIQSQSDLEAVWRHLVRPLRFDGHSLWLMFIEADGRAIPQLTEITDSETPPDADGFSHLATLLRRIVESAVPGGRVAFLLSRPGAGTLSAVDRAWAVGLYGAAREAAVPAETIHLAADEALLPVPLDELDLPRSA